MYSTFKMKATHYSETFYPATRRYKPEDRTLHSHCWENLKSNVLSHVFRTLLVFMFFYCTQNVTLYVEIRWCKYNATNTSHCIRVRKQDSLYVIL
jgi:hypothetical protein